VDTLSSFGIAVTDGAFVSVFANLVLADTLCLSVVSDLALDSLAKSCLESVASIANILVAFCDSLGHATSLSALCNVAILGGATLGVVWLVLTESVLLVASVNGAWNVVVANLWCVDTSMVGITSVDGALVSVIAGLWNVDASKLWVADVAGALVVILACSLSAPALWNLAVCVFADKAVVVSIALLPVLVLAEVLASCPQALLDLLVEALSRVLSSAVFLCKRDALWRSKVQLGLVFLLAKSELS